MDNKELLKSMLTNLINDNKAEASLDLHNYMSAKMKDVSGIGAPAVASDDTTDEVRTYTAADFENLTSE